MCLLLFHQYMQSRFATALLSKQRTNLFEMNKEGIVSCLGYISLYFIAARIGIMLRRDFEVRNLTLISISSYALFHSISRYIPSSRQYANAPFVVWMTALCTGHLAALKYIDDHLHVHSIILQLINQHQLIAFLIGNVLTGMINMVTKTLLLPDHMAFIILFVYQAIILILLHKVFS